jgi:hypothetical protein
VSEAFVKHIAVEAFWPRFTPVLEAIVRLAKLQTTSRYNFSLMLKISTLSAGVLAIRDAYLVLEAEVARIGQKINRQKTKYMIVAGNRTIIDARRTNCGYWRKEFRSRQRMCVLGNTYDMGLEIQRRIQTANRCFCGLQNICGHPLKKSVICTRTIPQCAQVLIAFLIIST